MKIRDYRFDLLKAFAMFCVVLSHVLYADGISGESHVMFKTAIVGFNMPLFFAASGYFAGRTAIDTRQMLIRCLRLLKTMAIFSVSLALLFLALGFYPSVQIAIKRMFTLPLYGWWLMWSLLFSVCGLRFFTMIRTRLGTSIFRTLVALCICICVTLLLPDQWWQVKYFKFCFPCYLIGYLSKEYSLLDFLETRCVWLGWLVCALAYAIYIFTVDGFAFSFYCGCFNISAIAHDWGLHYMLRYVIAVAGCVSVAVPILKCPNARWCVALAGLGTTTLGVYLLHQEFLKWFVVPLYTERQLGLIGLVAITFVVWLACHLVTDWINRTPVVERWVFK